tara:strand:+ start:1167 stop:1373 length:207 start_codon:yes stop_codon:yes gene_type:complete
MRVRATNRGTYGPRRWSVGAEFTLTSDRHFNASWMEAVEEAPAKKKPGRPKKKPVENDPAVKEQAKKA